MKYTKQFRVMIDKEDYKILYQLGGQVIHYEEETSVKFSHINNLDNSIRWVYHCANKKPSFLKFYNISGWKSYLIDKTIRTLFFLNLKKVVASGNINVQIEENSILKDVIEDSKDFSFSIFTGTKGDNRKVVIESDSVNYGKIFSKVAISDNSKRLVQTEYENLIFLSSLKLTSFRIPKVLNYNSEKSLLSIEDVRPNKFKKSMGMSGLKVQFVQNLIIRTGTEKVLSETQFYSILKCRIESLDLLNRKIIGAKNISGLIELLVVFLKNLEEDKSYKFSFAHGDFTPWNLFETQKDLRVIDWELGKPEIPIFYDYFHYFFQSEILVNRNGSDEIFKKIKEVELLEEMKSLIKDDYLILYLLEVSSYYIEKFLKQKDLHEQVFWLLDTWEETLNILQKNKLFSNE